MNDEGSKEEESEEEESEEEESEEEESEEEESDERRQKKDKKVQGMSGMCLAFCVTSWNYVISVSDCRTFKTIPSS